MEEDYVSFDTTMLLKEHGFNEKCNYVYDHDGTMIAAQNFMEGESSVDCDDIDSVAKRKCWTTYTQGEYAYLCPTLQRAIKWLRDEKGVAIIPIIDSIIDCSKFLWDIKIIVAKTNETFSQG